MTPAQNEASDLILWSLANQRPAHVKYTDGLRDAIVSHHELRSAYSKPAEIAFNGVDWQGDSWTVILDKQGEAK